MTTARKYNPDRHWLYRGWWEVRCRCCRPPHRITFPTVFETRLWLCTMPQFRTYTVIRYRGLEHNFRQRAWLTAAVSPSGRLIVGRIRAGTKKGGC